METPRTIVATMIPNSPSSLRIWTQFLMDLICSSSLNTPDPDAGRYWGQDEKGMTEDEMARWHQRLDGHDFE